MAWVLGYGSLLHPDSLRRTLPQVSPAQIRPVQVAGARRIFNLVSPGWARLAGGIQGEKVAALNAVPAKDCRMNAVAFWLGEEEVEPLDRREFCYYKVLDVPFVEWAAGDGQTGSPEKGFYYSVLDAAALQARFPRRYREEFEPLGADGLISDAVLPQDDYLSVCLQGAEGWGADYLSFFLETTYLGDGRTPLAEHLSAEEIDRHLQADVAAILERKG